MQVVREQFALAKSNGLFRAASAVDVTSIIVWEVLGLGAERSKSSSFAALPQVSQVKGAAARGFSGEGCDRL